MAMVLNLPTLTPGHYKVSWHVVSVDTHRTEGSFSFDIQP
jgi:methionine-rich copper-binding protein CopC